ncbi:trehalose-6-phosphate synthase [Corynebacterium qintianiae]|uniref:alpha,alpha-trehalose-phosphate synthase (ADP-forming) n=1 Tax=Corynebacterium qintianiae TaxID=2709392 RepID=A0A7T0KM46_9CORY|nr:trehalose-6-phosphate synthase [Corynebacterium qintianiae]QPK82979.1 trehalose-6-phosphate synthase [Corynebacterium qintianiae]
MTGDNKFVVVANRLPVDRTKSGWRASPGGLVAALAPVLRAHSGCWVGWPGEPDTHVPPFDFDGISLHPVGLSGWDFENFYEGFSNSSLWPLYHDLIVTPQYSPEWWDAYKSVNKKFADAVAAVAAEGATVWVQDYQLQLVPGLLKEARPDLTIGFFLHIPFPSPDLFKQLPWREDITRGLEGCDLIGFQRDEDEQNFRALVGASGPRTGAFPISIDPGAIHPGAREDVDKLREKLGNPRTLMLGVDRLDYTKGILQRLLAIENLLEQGELDDVAVVQLATPSRERIEHYKQTRREVEEAVGRINGRFGSVGTPVIHYIHRPVPKGELGTYYAAADVMLVTPFKDGMNLVAKEYVSCHPDGDGALVLSEFAGAAVELNQAYLCNPFDLESIQQAILGAVDGDPEAMRAMHKRVTEYDVDRWAQTFLEAL